MPCAPYAAGNVYPTSDARPKRGADNMTSEEAYEIEKAKLIKISLKNSFKALETAFHAGWDRQKKRKGTTWRYYPQHDRENGHEKGNKLNCGKCLTCVTDKDR